MKPYGAREPYVGFIECYCPMCCFGLTGKIARSKPRVRRTAKRKERQRAKKEIQNERHL